MVDEAQRLRAAQQEVLRRGREIIDGKRFVGGPRAVGFDLAGVAARALGQEMRGAEAVEQKTWLPPEQREPKKKGPALK